MYWLKDCGRNGKAADVIYGVTMGRDSASQIISLKLDEVSEEMLRTGRG